MSRAPLAMHITGLAEFSRSVKVMDATMPKALRLALNEAGDVVVTAAVPKIKRRSGAAAATVKARATATAVRVVAGGKRAVYYPWLDFGGRVGKNKSVRRAFMKYGRYLYPAYFEQRDKGTFEAVLKRALIGLATEAGLEVT